MGKNKRSDLGPPPRWLHCPRKGQIIVDIFVPFKTPLDGRYDDDVPEECRFNVSMLFDSLKMYKKKLGLVVDLTNTTRFYDKLEVEKRDCRYVKMQCRGHGETPSKEQTQAFIELVARFHSQKPLEMIGIHCTHGFNRTGVDAAVQLYAQARSPGIYKQDYLQELFHRYGDVDDTPAAPILPEWCNESEEGNAKFVDGVTGVKQVGDQPRLGSIQQKVQDMCDWKGFMMLIDGEHQVFMLDRDNTVFHVPNLMFPRRKDLNGHTTNTLLDGEMIVDTVNGQNVPRFLIYDIIKFEPYHPGRCKETLKWKPPELNSVDFKMVIKMDAGGEGMLASKRALLYVTGLEQPFSEMKYTKDLKELDKKIIECCFDPTTNAWKYMRVRTDKSFPNHYTTAVAVCDSIKYPVTKEMLFRVVEVERWMPPAREMMPPPVGRPLHKVTQK
ncbi:MCE1-like protein [Mya arenaria]|uniref:mRNA guanylyltransferase n=1 Tax=Mya arenaria TaxID=6604 RepID=A0ABY7FFD5_MYAAR|nr:MCE1-like protein [Mya arenaria]